jgi:curved DNA-binding protein CbpA
MKLEWSWLARHGRTLHAVLNCGNTVCLWPMSDPKNPADYYAALGVGRDESLQGIQAAYRRRAKQCHPDHAGAEGREQFQAIHQAYEVLSDPARRKEYDATLDRRLRASHRRARPESFVPFQRPIGFGAPEPLIRSSAEPEPLCAPALSRRCVWCAAVHSSPDLPCPYLQRDEFFECDLAQWMVTWLRTFQREPW